MEVENAYFTFAEKKNEMGKSRGNFLVDWRRKVKEVEKDMGKLYYCLIRVRGGYCSRLVWCTKRSRGRRRRIYHVLRESSQCKAMYKKVGK